MAVLSFFTPEAAVGMDLHTLSHFMGKNVSVIGWRCAQRTKALRRLTCNISGACATLCNAAIYTLKSGLVNDVNATAMSSDKYNVAMCSGAGS